MTKTIRVTCMFGVQVKRTQKYFLSNNCLDKSWKSTFTNLKTQFQIPIHKMNKKEIIISGVKIFLNFPD